MKKLNRRDFVKATAAVTAGAIAAPLVHAGGSDELRVGVIGCGGRGTGAANDALQASQRVRIVALADVFRDRLEECRSRLAAAAPGRATVALDSCWAGFDAARALLATDLDIVILATPPHFRPAHFAAAVAAGRHVFMEKPVAVDPAGVRRVLSAADAADRAGLSVVAGTQRRHEACYLEAMRRVHDGAIGRIVSARCSWNMGGLWMHPRLPEWSDMEWQLRNWLYFTWLSGDHIVEQHVHNLDVVSWAVGAHPIRAIGMGGRQVRTGPEYGQVFDHFAIEYEYPGDVWATSFCRQIDGCSSRVEESIQGSDGFVVTRSGFAHMESTRGSWVFEGDNPNPYVREHVELIASIEGGTRVNEARAVAESTLTAIMGRMSAYTGREITWEQALASPLDLTPPAYEFGDLPVAAVAIPGRA